MGRYTIEYYPDQEELIKKIAEEFGIGSFLEADVSFDVEKMVCDLFNKEDPNEFPLILDYNIEEEKIQKFKTALKSNDLNSVAIWS